MTTDLARRPGAEIDPDLHDRLRALPGACFPSWPDGEIDLLGHVF